MARNIYTPKDWVTGDVIKESDLDHLEQGVYNIDNEIAAARGEEDTLSDMINNTISKIQGVHIDDAQNLTDTQKTTARNNIDAASTESVANNTKGIYSIKQTLTYRGHGGEKAYTIWNAPSPEATYTFENKSEVKINIVGTYGSTTSGEVLCELAAGASASVTISNQYKFLGVYIYGTSAADTYFDIVVDVYGTVLNNLNSDIANLKNNIQNNIDHIFAMKQTLTWNGKGGERDYTLLNAPSMGTTCTFINRSEAKINIVATDGAVNDILCELKPGASADVTFNKQYKTIGIYIFGSGGDSNLDIIVDIYGSIFNDLNNDITALKSTVYTMKQTFTYKGHGGERNYTLWSAPDPGSTYTFENKSEVKINIVATDGTNNEVLCELKPGDSTDVLISKQYSSFGVYIYGQNASDTYFDIIIDVYGSAFNELKKPLFGKKVMFFGDSITLYENSYRPILLKNTGMQEVANLAVSGAVLTNETDTIMDGNPTSESNNTVPNQIQKMLNNTYEIPDIIVISAGTNGLVAPFNGGLDETQFTNENAYIPIDSCDLTKVTGAMRWVTEKIHDVYPNAQIFFATPIQASEGSRKYNNLLTRRNAIVDIAHRLSVSVIDAFFDSGVYGAYETKGENGKYLRDGLHPNTAGANRIAKCYEAAIIANLRS